MGIPPTTNVMVVAGAGAVAIEAGVVDISLTEAGLTGAEAKVPSRTMCRSTTGFIPSTAWMSLTPVDSSRPKRCPDLEVEGSGTYATRDVR